MSFFAELKRRNVVRVGIAYAVIGWFLAQVAEFAFENFDAPPWVLKSFVVMLLLGLPIALFFAWAFEMTPEGVKREEDVDRSKSITHTTGRKLDFIIIAALAVALAYFLWERQAGVDQAEPAAPAAVASDTEVSIAVLPFVNMSSDKENEYFADGLSEELLNQLAQIPNLLVAGRTSSFSFKGKNEDLRAIGATLDVANVLEGSVRRQGNNVRVTAQLIRVSDGFHLWSNTYDRTMDDVFLIQDDISANVAAAMKIVLDEPSRQRMQRAGVRNVEAFVEYQKGRELFRLGHGSDDIMGALREGIVHFERAIQLVPEFGVAYWEMSDYYGHVIIGPDSTDDERALALVELRKVLDSAHQYSVDSPRRPMIDFDRVLFSDDWTLFRDRIEKALVPVKCPEPTWIEAAQTEKFQRAALDMWQQYQRCEPLAQSAYRQIADIAGRQGQHEFAFDVLDDAEIRLGASPWIDASRQWLFLLQGEVDEALAIAPRVVSDASFFGMGAEALPLALSGDVDAARVAMEQWQAINGRNTRSELEIHAAMGDREQANKLAAELDSRPGGPMLLLLSAKYCSCGAPWDLEATPNFRDRIREAGTTWPRKTLIKYPAKDW
jgi:TolB-like protein